MATVENKPGFTQVDTQAKSSAGQCSIGEELEDWQEEGKEKKRVKNTITKFLKRDFLLFQSRLLTVT